MKKAIVPMLQLLTCVQFIDFLGISASYFQLCWLLHVLLHVFFFLKFLIGVMCCCIARPFFTNSVSFLSSSLHFAFFLLRCLLFQSSVALLCLSCKIGDLCLFFFNSFAFDGFYFLFSFTLLWWIFIIFFFAQLHACLVCIALPAGLVVVLTWGFYFAFAIFLFVCF